MCPAGKAAVTGYSYELAHADGTTQKVGDLTGNKVRPGDHITVTFAIAPECTDVEVSFASYRAPAASFDPNTAVQQTLYDSDTGFFDAGGGHTLAIDVPATPGTPGPNCPNTFHDNSNGGGANQSPGPYDTTCDGSPSQNGVGDGGAKGKPCAGCVGNADNMNPPGQYPDGSDHNAGYECDRNQGVGKTNPAHSGCSANRFFQVDFAVGPVLPTLGPARGSRHRPRLSPRGRAFGHRARRIGLG